MLKNAIQLFIRWCSGKRPSREVVELLWMDLREHKGQIESLSMEGKSRYGEYYSDSVYLYECTEKGPYTKEHWYSLDGKHEFICDTELVTIFRSEEVLREI